MYLQNELTNKDITDMYSRLDECIKEALKRKGFEFDNNIEFESFLKNRCRCVDSIQTEERTFYIDDAPFFLWNYKTKFDTSKLNADNNYTISASIGKYAYL